jgi:hypothetical protein
VPFADYETLRSFHESVNSKEAFYRSLQRREVDLTHLNLALKVSMEEEDIFGQRMFVVDIECVPMNKKLATKEITVRERAVGTNISGTFVS